MAPNPDQPPQAKLDADTESPPSHKEIPREGPAVYQPFPRGLIVAIMIGICVWAGYLAVGSWLGGDAKFQLGPNFWRGVMVVGCFAVFLLFWGCLMRKRKPKKAKYRQ
jgi:hypothetical protein